MKKTQSGARTLERGLAILDALAANTEPTGVTELAEQVGLDKSTTHRLLSTLVRCGYARQETQTRYYTLGAQALVLYDAFQGQLGLQRICHPLLKELADSTGETSHLAVLSGMNIVFVDWVGTAQVMGVRTVVGRSEPAYCTALGKAILAALSPAVRVDMLANTRFEAYTDRTSTTLDTILQELEISAARGWALDNEEFLLGVRCLASAVLDCTGNPVAALGISGPASRLSLARCGEVGAIVLQMARRASSSMGCIRLESAVSHR